MDAVGYLPSPIGRIKLVLNEDRQLVRIDLNVPQSLNCETPALFKDIFTQFSEYFEGTRRDFTLPLCLNGRAFEMRVWKALLKIPYGETHSYGEIAPASDYRSLSSRCRCIEFGRLCGRVDRKTLFVAIGRCS